MRDFTKNIQNVLLALGLAAMSTGAFAQELTPEKVVKPFRSVKSSLVTQAQKGIRFPKALGEVLKSDSKARKSIKGETDTPYQYVTLVEEDFSKMTKGSADKPDSVGIWDPDTWDVSSSYTQTPGWSGEGLYQAGGAVALAYPGVGGVLNTPVGYYDGRIVVTFRAKCLAEERHYFFVSLLRGGIDYPEQADSHYETAVIYADDGWVDYRFEFTNPYYENDCFVQLNAETYDDGIIVDDFKVQQATNFINKPTAFSAEDFTTEGFTAKWNAVRGAQDYLVNLYEFVPQTEDNTTTTENFDNVKLQSDVLTIDPATMPAGWTFTSNPDSAQLAKSSNGTQGIYFPGLGQNTTVATLTLPGNGGHILDMSFFIEKTAENSSTMVEEGYNTTFILEGYNGKTWKRIGSFNVPGEVGQGGYIKMSDVAAQQSGFDFSGLYTRVQFSSSPNNDQGAFIIDDVSLYRTPGIDTTLVKTDVATTDTTIAFTGLNMDDEHYFTVRARKNADIISEGSDLYHAFGLPAPVATAATGIDESGEFTANWNEEPKANAGYYITLSKKFTAPGTVENYTVLEEDFSKVTSSATKDEPESCGNIFSATTLDNFTQRPGWLGWGNVISNGMLGCYAAGSGAQFEVVSPELDLSNGDKSFTVTVTVYSSQALDLTVQATNDPQTFTLDAGTNTVTANFTDGEDATRVWFYSNKGVAFLLDDVKVTQTLQKGNEVYFQCPSVQVGADELSYTFFGLDADPGTSYYYQVYGLRQLFGESAVSKASNEIEVQFSATGLNSVAVEAEDAITVSGNTVEVRLGKPSTINVYSLSGMVVARMAGSKGSNSITLPQSGIYIVRTDSANKKVVIR